MATTPPFKYQPMFEKGKDTTEYYLLTKENLSLEELMRTWMAKLEDNCMFISAREKTNIEEMKTMVYRRVKELHVQKYPYNDFLYQTYDENGEA